MTKKIGFFLFLALFIHCQLLAQVRVSGSVVDENNEPIPFANILLKGSIKGTVSDEKGKFYIEADEYYKEMEVTFMGYEKAIVPLEVNNYNLVIVLKEDADILKEVTVYSGRVKNKNNPAIDILRKIWEKKRKNGLNLYNDFEYSKYEKIEFDLNNIDEKFKSSKVFKGMEFIFDQVDTSSITGKPYLPIFINESAYKIYGTNTIPKKFNEKLLGNKNSGFQDNQGLIAFI